MSAVPTELSTGERVAYYRRRRGITQTALADLVGRSESWIEKVENGRVPLDRVSVIRELARALGVSLHGLLPDEESNPETGLQERGVPALRELVLSYRAVNPRLALLDAEPAPITTTELRRTVDDVWSAYQDSKFGYTVMQLNRALPLAYATTRTTGRLEAVRSLAYLYQAAASVLVKLGDLDLARLCAERGDIAAQDADDPITLTSLQRSIAHAALSVGPFEEAVTIVRDGLIEAPTPRSPAAISVVGTLMFVGATASARAGERSEAAMFLRHADRLAGRLGGDGNAVWTAFGPTNVAIHQVTVAAELGDPHRALQLGSDLDVSASTRERRVRHELEMARALTHVGRRDDAVVVVLRAEQGAPEQVRRHFLTHDLVRTWIRTTRTRPRSDLVALARRLGHAA
jgi:transcriptional regulator with XRE-family HTH domain